MALWNVGFIETKEMWRVAYKDGGANHVPLAVEDADLQTRLPEEI